MLNTNNKKVELNNQRVINYTVNLLYVYIYILYVIMKTMYPPSYHHNGFMVITGRAHCFHDNIYITLIWLLWDLSTLCVVHHLWPLIYILYIIYIIYFIYYIYTCICIIKWLQRKPINNKLIIYCKSEFHLFAIISQEYFISVLFFVT